MELRRFFRAGRKPASSRQELARHDRIKDALVKLMAADADGELDESEVARMAEIYRETTGSEVSPAVIRAGVCVALERRESFTLELGTATAALEPGDKAEVLYAGVRVALANASFDASESSLLAKAAAAMSVPPEVFQELVVRARSQLR